MKARLFFFVWIFLFTSLVSRAQQVVVSSYFNSSDPRDEWIELLVVTDNTDMRGWTIRDNNSTQTAWQTAVTFSNNSSWNNMRAGTIIMLWNRVIASDGVTAHTTDINKKDGYIELTVQNASYFTGGSFGTSPTWAGATLNLANGGDIIQLRNSSGTHVHALGHIATPGTDWNALPSPKLNHASTISSGEAVYVCPGASVADYGTSTPQNGSSYTAKSSTSLTFGLPNSCSASTSSNTSFWLTERQPSIASQSVTPSSVVAGTPGSLTFSWAAATDPNPGDSVTGYIILRNTVSSFVDPSNGTTYSIGSTIGTASVVGEIDYSGTTTFTDSTVMNGNSYYYRVYAFRYGTDDLNGNSYHQARGRAYNTTSFVTVDQASPLPIELLSFTTECDERKVLLQWTTATETNNHYFTVERAGEEGAFWPVAIVQGAGTTTQMHSYAYTDVVTEAGDHYYRLKQTDHDGRSSYSPVVSALCTAEQNTEARIFPNPVSDVLYIDVKQEEAGRWVLLITDASGRKIMQAEGAASIDVSGLSPGIYVLSIIDNNKISHLKFVKVPAH